MSKKEEKGGLREKTIYFSFLREQEQEEKSWNNFNNFFFRAFNSTFFTQ